MNAGARGAGPRAPVLAALPVLLVALAWPIGPAHAAGTFPVRGYPHPLFVADATSRPDSTGRMRVQVSWEVAHAELAFRREGDVHRARYDVTIVFHRDGRQVAGDVGQRRVRVRSLAETTANGAFSKGRRWFDLPPGVFDVEITLTDRNSRTSSRARGRLEVAAAGTRFELSDLRFVRYTEAGARPEPGHEIASGAGDYAARLTILPLGGELDALLVTWTIRGRDRRAAVERDTTLVPGGRETTLDIPIPGDALAPGEYTLAVVAVDPGDGCERKRSSTFRVRLTGAWFARTREAAATLFEILEAEEEREALAREEGEGWSRIVREFWDRRDPTPATPRNEYRDEILSRFETAAALFDEPFRRPGWKTDRGRVLVRHGPPASRLVNEGGVGGAVSEIWEYAAPARRFLFVDERGVGEFLLVGGVY